MSLFDVAYAFYSHDRIKSPKEKICISLKRDIVWRKDPKKKKKDLQDLLYYLEEFKEVNKHVKYVTMPPKKMPPVGLEVFAPILTNLAEDIMKLNEVIPKILDIKSEVCNTADTVRQMQLDVNDLKKKFTSAVTFMEGAAKVLRDDEFDVINQLRSFRQSIGITRDTDKSSNAGVRNDGLEIVFKNGINDLLNNGRSYVNALVEHQQHPIITTSPKVEGGSDCQSPTAFVAEQRTSAITKEKQVNKRPQTSRLAASERRKVNGNAENEDISTEESDGEGLDTS